MNGFSHFIWFVAGSKNKVAKREGPSAVGEKKFWHKIQGIAGKL